MVNKKRIRLNIETVKNTHGYVTGGLESLIKDVLEPENDVNTVRMNFEVSENLRNKFKSKTARQGKRVKDVLVCLMNEYVKDLKDNDHN